MEIKINKGQLLIELVLTIGLAALLIPTLMIGLMASRDGKVRQIQQAQAVSLLKETEEAVRAVQKSGWSFMPPSSLIPYHPEISGNLWTLVSGASTSAGLTQEVFISDVNRDDNGNIVAAPSGTIDPSTKKAEIRVSWTQPTTNSINSIFYLTRTDNLTQKQTTYDQFNAGHKDHVQLTTVSDGEVKLSNNDKAKWCSPSISDFNIPLPDPPVAVAATASAFTSIPNDVFVATSPNTTSAVKLAYINVTANQATPTATMRGKFTLDSSQYTGGTYPSVLGNPPSIPNLTNSFKTNDVAFYKKSDGKVYALLATDLPDKEIVAAQINDGSGDAYQDITNKIYKYHTFFNTRIYSGSPPVVQNFDTGFLSPSANAASTGGDGNGFERDPTRAYADGSGSTSYAEDRDSGTATGTTCGSAGKDRHRYYDYNINIPAGVTIGGIEVRLDAWVNSTSGSPDPTMCVELSWDGGNTWTSAISSTLGTSQATETYGGSTNTWGRAWSVGDFTNANFRMRITNVGLDNTRDFFLDWAAVKVYYSLTDTAYDRAPYTYGATSLAILDNKGYMTSGGYLYVFDLSNIDSKSPSNGLDMLGCRIQLDGYDCNPGSPATVEKYDPGESGTSWGDDTSAIHNDCSDGGNIELYATNDVFPIKVGANTYVYVAVGGVTPEEFEIINVTTLPTGSTSPTISNAYCGATDTSNNPNSGWRRSDTIDFNNDNNTEEAANSVFGNSDGTRAYISSNGGVDADGANGPDSKQFYILNTSNKSDVRFLSGSGSPEPANGYYNGAVVTPPPSGPSYHNEELFTRSSLTVLDGKRAVLVGKDGIPNSNNAQEYQVISMDPAASPPSSETNPRYCGGIYNSGTGFNGLTSVSEKDGDNFVYIIANTTNNELKIIQGGVDEGIYMPAGNFVSNPIVASTSTIFNRFVANIDSPANTTLTMQVAVAPIVGPSCSTDPNYYTFIGPNGNPALDADGKPLDFYSTIGASISGAIRYGSINPNYQNPNRCFLYKAWLTTENNDYSPQLKDVTVNHAP